MKNVLASIVDKAAEEIVELRTRAMQQLTPSLDLLNDVEYPEMKENLKKSLEDMDNVKEEMINKVKESGTDFIEDVRTELNDLGVDLGLLAASTAEFAIRTALIVPSIISFTAFGPALAPQQSPVLIKELTQEANELSTLYDKVNSKMNRLHLRELGSMSSFGLRNSGPKYAALNSIMTMTEDALAAAKPLILSSGADCDGEKGIPIAVEIPDYGVNDEIRADNCDNYDRIVLSYGDPDAVNCNRYQSLDSSKPRECSNCTNYIPINVNFSVKGWVYMKSKTFKIETTEGIELASDGTSNNQPPRNIQGTKLSSDNSTVNTGNLSMNSDSMSLISNNQTTIKSINKGIVLESKDDIINKTESNIVTESNNTTQTATGSGTLVYENGMDILVKNGNASITTQVGSFTVTTKKDNIFITEANFRAESTGTSEIKSGDTITVTSDAGMNLTVQKSVLETILEGKTSKINGDRLLDILGNLTTKVGKDASFESSKLTEIVTEDVMITSKRYGLTTIENSSIDSSGINFTSSLGTTFNVGGSLNTVVGANTSFVNTEGNFSISAKGYIDVSTTTGMQIMSQGDMFINSRSSLTLRLPEIIYEGMTPIPGISGALNCISTCPFTGLNHWTNTIKNNNLKV